MNIHYIHYLLRADLIYSVRLAVVRCEFWDWWHCVQVSLFAEMFNEMLMRDFGFRIYKLLVSSPEAAEDEKKDKPKDEDKKDKAKSKDDEKKDSSKARDVDDVKREGSDVERCDSKRSLQKTQASSKKDEQQEAEKMDDNEKSTQVSSFN